MEDQDRVTEIQQACWNKALEAYGTAYIFEQRAFRVQKRLTMLSFLGIAVPAAMGAVVLSFNLSSSLFNTAVALAGILGLVELLGSIWSLAAGWQESYSYALESLGHNHHLSNRFKNMAQTASEDPAFIQQYELITREDEIRSTNDNKQGISDMEKRMGMRAALRQFQRECAHCGEVPASMEASDCEVCGNFKRRNI
jgi:mobilome CxxCx(11)CxxC protein